MIFAHPPQFAPYPCLDCSKVRTTCCEGNPRVPFTLDDIARVEARGFNKNDFLIAGEYRPETLEGSEAWWLDSMVVRGGRYYRLNVAKQPDGSCWFLEQGMGCRLGPDRPIICRAYPLWIFPDDQIDFELDQRCGIAEQCCIDADEKRYDVVGGIELIGEDYSDVKRCLMEFKYADQYRRAEYECLLDLVLYGRNQP